MLGTTGWMNILQTGGWLLPALLLTALNVAGKRKPQPVRLICQSTYSDRPLT